MTDFGTDIATPVGDDGLPDLDPFFGLVDGYTALAQALLRRVVTPTGAVIDDPAYGHDVRVYLNDADPSPTAIAAAVRAQWLADERVEDARVVVTFADNALRIEGVVLAGEGPFRLVLAVSAVTAEILTAEAA